MNRPPATTPQPLTDDRKRFRQIATGLIAQSEGTGIQLRVTSTSMMPMIRSGDTILVETHQEKPFRRGDIVVRLEETPPGAPSVDWVVHRLVGKSKQGWLTKGDHLRAFDRPAKSLALIGQVIQINRRDRTILLQQFPWPWVNRYLGLQHYWLGIVFYYLRRLRGRVKST
jgi:signal peptidase I